MNYLEFDGVGFGYSEQAPILSQVNLTIGQGERLLILGANGSGKSTLGLLAAGVLRPTRGRLIVGECGRSIRRGIVFQNSRSQMVGASVQEDLAFGLTVLNRPAKEIREKVERYLEMFGLASKRDYGVQQLSGGELRRLALASVLITEPDLIVLDEPLAMLDQANQDRVLEILASLIPKETAVIWLDHDLRSVRHLPTRYILTPDGCVRPVTLDMLNSKEFLAEYGLRPAPLQALEWKYPHLIKNAILGPKAVEVNSHA